MCYDVNRGVAIMFGGIDATLLERNDLWEWNGFGWVERSSPTVPPARWGHGMTFDSRRNQVMMFGGFVPGVGCVDDTWAWNGSTWQQLTTRNSPPARQNAGIAYDSVRGRTVLHGGIGDSPAPFGDTWEFNGFNWSQSATDGPSARSGVAMTFDDTRGQVVLFGGTDGTQSFAETWTYDGLAWTQRVTSSAPSPRVLARMEHDTLCGRAVLHGGADVTLATDYNDSWAWDGSSWTQLPGATPQGRHGSAMAFDAQRGQTVLFGGRDVNGCFADTWQIGSPCNRTMSVVTLPQVGKSASFRFNYPGSATGNFFFHIVAGHQFGSYSVPVPGIKSIGVSRVDLFTIYLQPNGVLDASGNNTFSFPIPLDNYLAGLQFDVQSVDFNVLTNSLYWANNDAEVTVAPVLPPVASFTAAPITGATPLAVQFTDTSTNEPTSWQWDFDNDGVVDSTQQNPIHTYAQAGLYSVRLVASNLGGSDSSFRRRIVFAGPLVPNPQIDMIQVAGGTFQMGSSVVGGPSAPVHSVTITHPMSIGKYEVTQAQYQAVMGSNPSFFQGASYPDAAQRPVERVTWNEAMAFCSALTASEAAAGRLPVDYQYRLPTEAEWEYVCRAGSSTEFNTGSVLTTADANFNNVPGQTTAGGSYLANALGLFDTHGNVFEWCLDSWDGSSNYPSSAVTDPYESSGPFRVIRGGGWFYSAAFCRSANRVYALPGFAGFDAGFRVVLAPVIAP